MTRITIPVVECNSCHDRTLPVDTESTVVTVKFPGEPEKTYSGENCKTCGKGLVDDIGPALEQYLTLETVKPKRRHRQAAADGDDLEPEEDRTCTICRTVCKTRGALRQHLKDTHNTNLKNLGLAKTGGRRPS